ncbi:hypothetical protein JOY44_14645 [Phormidium sp. CLA17]|uniref:hypothetical protein n=1 Tax=Leptolyngbya sp. Cla-17 TaxID=2803751 RepID=UPI00149129C9|nr:hypothetical protein [Leptolyngbya sp. Cla-17]MBM0742832.1 hypothetical protein [Leptolyngbya sp. Cla-17]
MLTQLRRPIHLSFSSADGLLTSKIETVGTLYQKDDNRYHLVLIEPLVMDLGTRAHALEASAVSTLTTTAVPTPRLLWIEFSPYRVSITMQGNGQFSYRHLFEPGVLGLSRYFLQDDSLYPNRELRLRNFTRNLHVKGNLLPSYLLLEYELRCDRLQLGQYTLSLEIHH